jgi:intraflagellar transport protein 56
MDDTPPEARLNLVIHHLRHGELGEAYGLVRDLEPSTPQEYILKGVVHACLGQVAGKGGSSAAADHLKTAQQYFQLVRW